MKRLQQQLAQKLLTINAIKLQPNNPFLWASGWKSPIYCDNRKTLAYPETRTFIKLELSRVILEQFNNTNTILGIATGAIPQGAMIADELNLPFAYIRSKPKEHGLKTQIEGDVKSNAKIVIVEDLISSGKSVLEAIKTIQKIKCHIEGIVSIFNYDFPTTKKKIKDIGIKSISLCNYKTLIEEALKIKYITNSELILLEQWRKSPSKWNIVS